MNAQADQASSERGNAIKQIPYLLFYITGLEQKIQRQNIETEPELKTDYLIWSYFQSSDVNLA